MDSILLSIKKLLGLNPSYEEAFDTDIIIHINSVFNILTQLGVGPINGFKITNDSETWNEYITSLDIEMVKSYIYCKIRLIFDPPANSSIRDAYQSYIDEFEWRLNVAVDPIDGGWTNVPVEEL